MTDSLSTLKLDHPAVAIALPNGTSVGGVTKWAVEMARNIAMSTSGRGILLEHPTDSREVVDTSKLAGVEVVRCGAFGPRGVTDTNLAAYGACLPAIFVPNLNPGTYATCAALSRRSGYQMRVIGYCHTYHEYYFDLLRHFEPIIHRFVAVSSECFQRLRDSIPHRAADILMRPHGVEVPVDLERSYSLPGQPIQLLYAGRIVEDQKRVFDLLRLARELTRLGVDYRLRIVGEGPDKPKLVRQHGMLDPETRARVDVLPGLSLEEMPRLLRSADVALLVSAYEGTSNFTLEALAQGCVPVVTRVSGTTDFIDRHANGTYTEVGDIAGLAAAIRELHADRDRLTRQGRQAYRSAAEHNDDAYYRWFRGFCNEIWHHDEPRHWPDDRRIWRARTSLKQRMATRVPSVRKVYRWVNGQPVVGALKAAAFMIRARTTHRPGRFRIFFIRGYMRSGTNWVCNLVNLHPQVLAAGEFHLNRIRQELDQLLARASPLALRLMQRGSRASFESWTRQCILDGVPWEEKASAVWLGDRTPATLEPILIEKSPSILLLRDGRDVLVSRTYHFLRRNGYNRSPFSTMPRMAEKRKMFLDNPRYFIERPHELLDDEAWVRSSARQWARHVAADRRALDRLDAGCLDSPVLVVRYEDLHADTSGWSVKIYEFLGVDPALAEPLDDLTSPGFTNEDPGSHYRKGAIGDWRDYFTPTVTGWFKEEAGEQLIREGYARDHDWQGPA